MPIKRKKERKEERQRERQRQRHTDTEKEGEKGRISSGMIMEENHFKISCLIVYN